MVMKRCPACGYPAEATTCAHCGIAMVPATAPLGDAPVRAPLGAALLALVLFWPAGLPALWYALKSRRRAAADRLHQAQEAAAAAHTLTRIGWVAGGLWLVLAAAFVARGLSSAG